MGKPKFYKNAFLYLAIGLIIVAYGFSRSYFGRLGEMAWPYHLHGISASLWMILLVVQPLLYREGMLKIHRLLGWSSVVLIPLITIGGVIMIGTMIRGQENYPPNTVYKLAFIDVWTLIGFAAMYVLALVYRRKLMLHSRFMVATIFGPLIPALTRVFFNLGLASSFNESLTYSYLLTEIVLLVLIVKERNMKEVRYTYLPFFVYTLVQHILMYFSNDWEWWQAIVNSLSNYSS